MRAAVATMIAAVLAVSMSAAQADAQVKKSTKKKRAVPSKVKAGEDKDIAAIGGTGVPKGFIGRSDRANMNLADAKYVRAGNAWNITTGPAHILYSPRDTASGSYTVTATIDQLSAPKHPEAYGIFVGGQNLNTDAQSYLYFLVRGTGEMFAKVREGETTRGVIAWQPTKSATPADATGKGSYKVAIQVTPDSVKFWVNDRQAAAVPSAGLPTNGVFGLRVNHNLHVRATPPVVTRP